MPAQKTSTSTAKTTTNPKLNGKVKNTFLISVSRKLRQELKLEASQVRAIKEDFRNELDRTKEDNEKKFVYTRFTKALQKKLCGQPSIKALKDTAKIKSVKELINGNIDELRVVYGGKPKPLATNYMKFSAMKNQELAEEFKELALADRSKKITGLWKALTDKQKHKYNPSNKEKKMYDTKKSNFEKAVAAYKGTVPKKA